METIEVSINGGSRIVPGGLTIAELLRHLDIDPSRVAVELNRQIIRKNDWDAARVTAGSSIEVVHFVGGGSR
jgi:thiamine biosynthesis protein ThiS